LDKYFVPGKTNSTDGAVAKEWRLTINRRVFWRLAVIQLIGSIAKADKKTRLKIKLLYRDLR
jgi:hypothetical protein